MDLIRRQDAIDAFTSKYSSLDFMEDGVIELYVETIDKLPSAQQWIPCSERLPERNGVYIVTRRSSDGFECFNLTDACYFDGTSTWHDDTRVNHERKYLADILAWMPLPKAYKGEQE